ncbi:DUF4184 family protein [Neisseria sp. WLZKY-1]|uniref:DUF4184 family protein n=1 Tax=Neisseria sp. WLZKY-1 TaxID=3390377 RepID=UPI00397B9993
MSFLLPAALKSRFRIIIGFQNMPFTLAHPIAILPFSRCRYCYFPALVIGSLSPDFVYFLHGRAVSGGHGLADCCGRTCRCASRFIGFILPCGGTLCLIFYQIA